MADPQEESKKRILNRWGGYGLPISKRKEGKILSRKELTRYPRSLNRVSRLQKGVRRYGRDDTKEEKGKTYSLGKYLSVEYIRKIAWKRRNGEGDELANKRRGGGFHTHKRTVLMKGSKTHRGREKFGKRKASWGACSCAKKKLKVRQFVARDLGGGDENHREKRRF